MALSPSDSRLPQQTRHWNEILNFNCVELIKHVWSKEFVAIANELEKRLVDGETKPVKSVGEARGETDAYWYDRVNPYRDGLDPVLEAKIKAIHDSWRSGENFRVELTLDRPTAEAVRESLERLEKLDALSYPDMTTIEDIASNYPFPLKPEE